MANSEWNRLTNLNYPQQPFARVTPQNANVFADAWIDTQQAARFAEHMRLREFVNRQNDDGSGDGDPAIVPQTPAWLQEIMQELSAASTGKQIAVGSFSGWCSGYLLGRIGKAAALAIGGSFIILQVAHYQGLIQINWNRVQQNVDATRRKLGHHVSNSNVSAIMNTIFQFGRRHIFLAGSFGAGFLIGIAM